MQMSMHVPMLTSTHIFAATVPRGDRKASFHQDEGRGCGRRCKQRAGFSTIFKFSQFTCSLPSLLIELLRTGRFMQNAANNALVLHQFPNSLDLLLEKAQSLLQELLPTRWYRQRCKPRADPPRCKIRDQKILWRQEEDAARQFDEEADQAERGSYGSCGFKHECSAKYHFRLMHACMHNFHNRCVHVRTMYTEGPVDR